MCVCYSISFSFCFFFCIAFTHVATFTLCQVIFYLCLLITSILTLPMYVTNKESLQVYRFYPHLLVIFFFSFIYSLHLAILFWSIRSHLSLGDDDHIVIWNISGQLEFTFSAQITNIHGRLWIQLCFNITKILVFGNNSICFHIFSSSASSVSH